MRTIAPGAPCPCGSGTQYRACCQPYILAKAVPPTPESLMRSRYSAYVAGAVDHLYRTTHPDSPIVKGIAFTTFARDTLDYCRRTDYTKLSVIDVRGNAATQNEGFVTFVADYTQNGKAKQQGEISRFLKVDGCWLYRDGRML